MDRDFRVLPTGPGTSITVVDRAIMFIEDKGKDACVLHFFGGAAKTVALSREACIAKLFGPWTKEDAYEDLRRAAVVALGFDATDDLAAEIEALYQKLVARRAQGGSQ